MALATCHGMPNIAQKRKCPQPRSSSVMQMEPQNRSTGVGGVVVPECGYIPPIQYGIQVVGEKSQEAHKLPRHEEVFLLR